METVQMTLYHNFDIRTVTLGINLKDCINSDLDIFKENVYGRVSGCGRKLILEAQKLEDKYGIPLSIKEYRLRRSHLSSKPASSLMRLLRSQRPLIKHHVTQVLIS